MNRYDFSSDKKQAIVEAQAAAYRKIRAELYRRWVLTIFCWDGLLPIVVILLPLCLKVLLPWWPVIAGLAGVFVPLTALSIRVAVGFNRMLRGQSYFWQLIVFLIGISMLFLVETFWLNDLVGKGPKISHPTLLLKMFSFYLVMMTISLFPLRALCDLRRRSREITKHIEKLN